MAVELQWNNNFAYAIGLLASDGCLSSDGRHLDLTSKDKEQILNFMKCLGLKNKIGRKSRDKEKIKKYYRVQFGDVKLYRFLCSIGLKARKSKTLERVDIPINFFADFLRGIFDGDGSFVTFKHPESRNIQIRVKFYSASPIFLRWLQQKINNQIGRRGFISKSARVEALEYAIADSLKLLSYLYYSPNVICLSRKFQKVQAYYLTRKQT